MVHGCCVDSLDKSSEDPRYSTPMRHNAIILPGGVILKKVDCLRALHAADAIVACARQVMAALSKAVDDRKRAVRAAAVRCRRKWGAQPM